MTAVVDNLIAVRILYLLVMPFTKWPAHTQGLIDETGNRTDKDVGDSDDWSMLHRLAARLKRILGSFPGGKSVIASIAAAYLLVRECIERDIEPMYLEEVFNSSINSGELMTVETYVFVTSTIESIVEEGAPTMSVTGIAGIKPNEDPPGKLKKRKMKNDSTPELG